MQCINPLTMLDSPACLYPGVKTMCLGITVSCIYFFHSFMVLGILDILYVVVIVLSAGDIERIKNMRAYLLSGKWMNKT